MNWVHKWGPLLYTVGPLPNTCGPLPVPTVTHVVHYRYLTYCGSLPTVNQQIFIVGSISVDICHKSLKKMFIKSALLHYKYITVPLQKIPLKKVIIEKFKKSPLYKKSYVNFFKQNYYRYKKTVFKKITDPYTYHSIRAITNLTNWKANIFWCVHISFITDFFYCRVRSRTGKKKITTLLWK